MNFVVLPNTPTSSHNSDLYRFVAASCWQQERGFIENEQYAHIFMVLVSLTQSQHTSGLGFDLKELISTTTLP